ncbi:protease complex subunit PrcB family protein [Flavobacterium pectinovorum]|uniref:protease complex subunit PrcB family protein n=1 Tax=Flavobacterium pectinovorum TaxID=29533 RepID=UPI001FABCE6A|nr:protease complex subunit PrcB family protein [Flavobacterium pectinovorum]MCI9844103.1 protease complex subunit PrcB family protein [Flavobacterium pectinovorum]
MKKLILSLFIAFGFSACSINDDLPQNTCGEYVNVPFSGFPLSCNYTIKEQFLNPSALVVNTEEKLNQYFTKHNNTCTVASDPNIDFTKNFLVGIFSGQKSTTGYGIKITSIVENDCQIFVNFYEHGPQTGETTTPGVNYPADYVLIPKTTKQIYFNKTNENKDNIVIGTFGTANDFFQLNDYNILKFLNVAVGAYEFGQYKYTATIKRGEYTLFLKSVPTEILNLKGQTKTYGTPDAANQGGVYFELHQGASTTKIYIDNNDTDDQSTEVKVFKKAIKDKILLLKLN